jgi:putative membrane protein
VAKVLTRPLPALAVFNAVVVLTHLPEVVDGLMDSQFGSFALDVVWIGAGIVLWWPAVRRVPELNGLSYPARFSYLLVATLLPMVPASFLTFAEYPIYATYELAPPLANISSGSDQLAAGLVMKFGGDAVILFAISVIFFRWHAAEAAQDGVPVLRSQLPDPQSRG